MGENEQGEAKAWPGQSDDNFSGSPAEAGAKELLAPLRDEIDRLDTELTDILRRRFDVVHKVAAMKAAHDIPTVDPVRMKEIKARIAARAGEHGMDPGFVARLYDLLFDEAIRIENRLMGRDTDEGGESA